MPILSVEEFKNVVISDSEDEEIDETRCKNLSYYERNKERILSQRKNYYLEKKGEISKY